MEHNTETSVKIIQSKCESKCWGRKCEFNAKSGWKPGWNDKESLIFVWHRVFS